MTVGQVVTDGTVRFVVAEVISDWTRGPVLVRVAPILAGGRLGGAGKWRSVREMEREGFKAEQRKDAP